MNTTIIIINDCRDANAAGRQIVRTTALLGSPAAFIDVSNHLEASGNLIDALDAIEGHEGVVLVNVAPRSGSAKKWNNGTPFGYFWYKKIIVVASVDGLTLSLVKKLRLVDSVNVLDIPTSLEAMGKDTYLSGESKGHIADSQFRSYDFLPHITSFLLKHGDIRSTPLNINEISDAPPAIWWVDNFGNCKTTILSQEITCRADNRVATKLGELPYYPRLKDVPDKNAALIIGSSGLGDKRFLEVVIQGDNAARHFNLSSGNLIL